MGMFALRLTKIQIDLLKRTGTFKSEQAIRQVLRNKYISPIRMVMLSLMVALSSQPVTYYAISEMSMAQKKFIQNNGEIYIKHADGMHEKIKNNGDVYIKEANGTIKLFKANLDIYIFDNSLQKGKVIDFKTKQEIELSIGDDEIKRMKIEMDQY